MSTNTLQTAYANGQIIDASHINELTLSLLGAFVGRNTSGIPASGQSLGTLAIPWGNVYAAGLVLNGLAFDTSAIVSSPNRIVSGKTRSLSTMPDFIRADGAALEFDVLGLTTNLLLSINNAAVTVNTDITKTGITAAPAANNTALVDDTNMTNDKYAGEDGTEIIIDTVGTEISSRIGQFVALKTGTEIMLAYVKSATVLSNVYRGFFFNSSGNPIPRVNLSNNDTLTILTLGWVFMENNGTTVDVSYTSPVVAYSAPTSPVTGDYWYDLANNVWKRYSGASFEIINRILIGAVTADATAVIGSRSFDFNKSFADTNNLDVEVFSTEIIKSKIANAAVSVYGSSLVFNNTLPQWNITTNLESPLTEAASTLYYAYMSDKGQSVISNEKPYYRPDLKGYYHPYHSWRCLAEMYNDGSSNIIFSTEFNYNPATQINSVATIKDVKNSGVDGGASTGAAFNTRVLNTLDDKNNIIMSLASNQFFLSKGTYVIGAFAPNYAGDVVRLRIRDITNSLTPLLGEVVYNRSGNLTTIINSLCGVLVVKSATLYELQQYVTTANGSGYGIGAGSGESEVYAQIKITRIK